MNQLLLLWYDFTIFFWGALGDLVEVIDRVIKLLDRIPSMIRIGLIIAGVIVLVIIRKYNNLKNVKAHKKRA